VNTPAQTLRVWTALVMLVLASGTAWAKVPLVRDQATPYIRPDSVPAASDVTMRSLRFRPDNQNDPQDTFKALEQFHATRLEWVYLADVGDPIQPEVTAKIKRVYEMGRLFGGASNGSSGTFVQWHEDTGNHVKKYNIVDREANPVIPGHMKYWARPQSPGCVNNPKYREGHLNYLKSYLDRGAVTMQRDEPSTQHTYAQKGIGCFGPYCMSGFRDYLAKNLSTGQLRELGITDIREFNYKDFLNRTGEPVAGSDLDWSNPDTVAQATGALHEHFVKFQLDATTEFFKWIREELKKYNNGVPVGYTCNNTSFQKWDEPYIQVFDFAISELMMRSANPGHIYERAQKARSLGKMQVFGTPKTMGKTYDQAWLTRLKRQVIATSYASGALSRVPWDIFQQSKDGNARYFGRPEDFADLYGFVRASHRYLDKYGSAGAYGPGIEDNRYGNSPPLETEGANDSLCLFLRAVPGDPNAPVVVHLVDWDEQASKPFKLRLRTDSFFPGSKLSVTLRVPAPYDSRAHADAEQHAQEIRDSDELMGPAQATAYESLVQTRELVTMIEGPFTVIEIPTMDPWGILIISPIQ
jgi:hypothetical protein